MRKTVEALENTFTTLCNSSYPYEWDENHLSFQLMKELRRIFSRRIINFNGWSKIVDWRSFKNRGKQETNYGDIALLVNIQFSSGEMLKGVAAIEAKRDFGSGCFESINHRQLSRIISNHPYAHLLLYTHDRQQLPLKFPDKSEWGSHIWVSPANTAKELLNQVETTDNRKLLRVSFPFTAFLTSRIFWGLDLDFSQPVIQDIESGMNNLINPSFMGVVNVYYEGQRPYEIALGDLWEEI